MKIITKRQMERYITLVGVVIGMLAIGSSFCFAQTQPQSTIQSTGEGASGKFYIPYNDTFPTSLTLSTAEVPNPNCPDDNPDHGGPDYYWVFGSLDAKDNHDGIWGSNGQADTPETLTVNDDVGTTYSVTVYCTQAFAPNSGGNDYTNSTTVSTEVQTTIQVPNSVTFTNSTDGSGFSNPASDYNFVLNDQAPTANPMANVEVTIYENVDAFTTTWSSATTSDIGDGPASGTITHGTAFPSSGTGNDTDDSGGWFDYIHPDSTVVTNMDNYAASGLYGSVIHLTSSQYSHSYTDASYQTSPYSFSPITTQSGQSFVWTDTYTQYLGGLVYWNSYSATQTP